MFSSRSDTIPTTIQLRFFKLYATAELIQQQIVLHASYKALDAP
jgi:hypothetical protein